MSGSRRPTELQRAAPPPSRPVGALLCLLETPRAAPLRHDLRSLVAIAIVVRVAMGLSRSYPGTADTKPQIGPRRASPWHSARQVSGSRRSTEPFRTAPPTGIGGALLCPQINGEADESRDPGAGGVARIGQHATLDQFICDLAQACGCSAG